MFPESLHRRQTGAGLPVAIFVITVLALIVTGIAQQQDSAAGSVSLQIQSMRAYFAASSGAEVGVSRVVENPAQCPATGNAWTVPFSAPGLQGCKSDVQCSSTTSKGKTIYTLTSFGQCGVGSVEQSQRRIRVRFR